MWWVSDTTIWATFDLRGLDTGDYDVQIDDDGSTAFLDDAFNVNASPPGELQVDISATGLILPDVQGTVTVAYGNSGETDILAPLLTLSAEGALLRVPEQSTFSDSAIQIMGINRDGPAGILPPGSSGTFEALFIGPGFGTVDFTVGVTPSSDTPVPWDLFTQLSRPQFVPADAWTAVWSNFTDSVGTTAADYLQVLSENATYLSQLGTYTSSVSRLETFELQQAESKWPFPFLTRAFDASVATPGLSLQFRRWFSQSLIGRYALGPLGRGWTHQWDISLAQDADGNVQIHTPGGIRSFILQSDGSYRGGSAEYVTLTENQGVFRLVDPDGVMIVFRSDSKLDYVEDTNGNRITVTYTGAQLTGLQHTSRASLALSYNGQGRISQVVDSTGWTTTYTYDAQGEHLKSVTTPSGTTTYSYDTTGGPARLHALTSIEFPGGTHDFFDYDDRGHVIGQHRDANTETLTYAYNTAGGVSVTDASGATTTLLFKPPHQNPWVNSGSGRAPRL